MKMSWLDFESLGYLQELNRQFMHPLGLEVVVGTQGVEVFNDALTPITFKKNEISISKYEYVKNKRRVMNGIRGRELGYFVQPISVTPPINRTIKVEPKKKEENYEKAHTNFFTGIVNWFCSLSNNR